MVTIYFARHGETLWNRIKKIQGFSDSPLTEKGEEQALMLSKRMEEIPLDIIISSSSGRAYKTAEIIKGKRDIEVIPNDNFREISLGKWEGYSHDFLVEKYGEEFNVFWDKPHLYEPVEGESFKDVQKRAINEVEKIVKQYNNSTILVVTHTVTIKVIMSYYEGRNIKDLWQPPFIHQTSLSRIDFKDNKAEIVMYGDDSHLI